MARRGAHGATSNGAAVRERFELHGYAGPLRFFDAKECVRIVGALTGRRQPSAVGWRKGRAISSRAYYELATDRRILDPVSALLGPHVKLWGASLIRKRPGAVHPWHTDIETSNPTGRTISVWIGLQNVGRESALALVPCSHRFGASLQEVAAGAGRARADITDEDVTTWAREHDAESGLVLPDIEDGEGLLFDGRLWHGSRNTYARRTRLALLLQYADPATPIRVPDPAVVEWPFEFLEAPDPGCIMVRGSDFEGVNRIVPGPCREPGSPVELRTWIKPYALPLAEHPDSGWNRFPAFRGQTGILRSLSCHVSVLSPGTTPHPPHRHAEEEILIVLDGALEVQLYDRPEPAEPAATHRLTPGRLVYYEADQFHTVHNAGSEPATYLMLKWRADDSGVRDPLRTSVHDVGTGEWREARTPGRKLRRLFKHGTRYLRLLGIHVSELEPGAGYPPHADAYDVAIVVLAGTVETLGRTVEPCGVVFYAAGEPHGMENVGAGPATYVVVEFHGAESGLRAAHGTSAGAGEGMRRRMRGLRRRLNRLLGRG